MIRYSHPRFLSPLRSALALTQQEATRKTMSLLLLVVVERQTATETGKAFLLLGERGTTGRRLAALRDPRLGWWGGLGLAAPVAMPPLPCRGACTRLRCRGMTSSARQGHFLFFSGIEKRACSRREHTQNKIQYSSEQSFVFLHFVSRSFADTVGSMQRTPIAL